MRINHIKLCYMMLLPSLAGCATLDFKGYIVSGTTNVLNKKPTVSGHKTAAIVLRDPATNGLNMKISPERNRRMLNSFFTESFNISIFFETQLRLPKQNPIIILPVMESNNCIFKNAFVGADRKSIVVSYSCNKLGKDLLLTTIKSTGGVKGLAHFNTSKTNVPLGMNSKMEFFVWASVYLKRTPFRQSIYIRSDVEFPFYLNELEFDSESKTIRRKVGKVVKPWKARSVYIKRHQIDLIGPTLKIDKIQLRTVPNKFYN